VVEIIIARYVIGARIKAVRGDRDAAADRLDDGAHAAAAFGLPRLRAHIDNERMRLDLPFAGPVAHEDALPDGLSGLLPNAFDTASARLPLVVRRDGYLCISVTHPDVIHCAATWSGTSACRRAGTRCRHGWTSTTGYPRGRGRSPAHRRPRRRGDAGANLRGRAHTKGLVWRARTGPW